MRRKMGSTVSAERGPCSAASRCARTCGSGGWRGTRPPRRPVDSASVDRAPEPAWRARCWALHPPVTGCAWASRERPCDLRPRIVPAMGRKANGVSRPKSAKKTEKQALRPRQRVDPGQQLPRESCEQARTSSRSSTPTSLPCASRVRTRSPGPGVRRSSPARRRRWCPRGELRRASPLPCRRRAPQARGREVRGLRLSRGRRRSRTPGPRSPGDRTRRSSRTGLPSGAPGRRRSHHARPRKTRRRRRSNGSAPPIGGP